MDISMVSMLERGGRRFTGATLEKFCRLFKIEGHEMFSEVDPQGDICGVNESENE